MQDRKDVYQEVTDIIVQQLEAGVRPWSKPWTPAGGGRVLGVLPLRSTGEAYRGVNVLLLWLAADRGGFSQRRWMTFKQAINLGAAVRKGERGSRVVFASAIEREVEGDNGETVEKRIPFMKAYTVFNVEQIDGLGAEWFDARPAVVEPVETVGPAAVPELEDFFGRVGALVRHGGGRAFYSLMGDYIQMPPLECFKDAAGYYSTRAHETVHWTGGSARCDRQFGARFGDARYAAEELVAEIGAAFLCASLGVSDQPREDHASYLASWLKVLKADKRAIFTAATKAQAAADFIHAAAEAARGVKEAA